RGIRISAGRGRPDYLGVFAREFAHADGPRFGHYGRRGWAGHFDNGGGSHGGQPAHRRRHQGPRPALGAAVLFGVAGFVECTGGFRPQLLGADHWACATGAGHWRFLG
nr:hypothetical protein [Tanacetum cinerariifolium]